MAKLFNPTRKPSSFLYGGQEFTVEAGELSQDLPAEIILHYQRHVNGPLEVDEDAKEEVKKVKAEKPAKKESGKSGLEAMAWNELQQMAKRAGVYSFGMSKAEVLAALKEVEDAGS